MFMTAEYQKLRRITLSTSQLRTLDKKTTVELEDLYDSFKERRRGCLNTLSQPESNFTAKREALEWLHACDKTINELRVRIARKHQIEMDAENA
jgi:hypothetical protein